MENIIDENLVFLDVAVGDGGKKQALKEISTLISGSSGLNEKNLFRGFLDREELSTTGFGAGVAIPHTKINTKQGIVGFVRFSTPIEWDSVDNEPVKTAIVLIMPKKGKEDTHLKMLSKLARLLMHETFIDELNSLESKKEIQTFLNKKLEES